LASCPVVGMLINRMEGIASVADTILFFATESTLS